MHDCCEGNNCKVEPREEIKTNTKQYDAPIIVCHHQEIVCKHQQTWYGPTKYCSCPYHVYLVICELRRK